MSQKTCKALVILQVFCLFIWQSNKIVVNLQPETYQFKIRNKYMNRTIITVVGKDTVGIIAKVCTYLAENSINILDISQTIVQEYFNMMMIVDMSKMQKTFEEVADELTNVGKAMGVQIKCQREEIFNMMHRI